MSCESVNLFIYVFIYLFIYLSPPKTHTHTHTHTHTPNNYKKKHTKPWAERKFFLLLLIYFFLLLMAHKLLKLFNITEKQTNKQTNKWSVVAVLQPLSLYTHRRCCSNYLPAAPCISEIVCKNRFVAAAPGSINRRYGMTNSCSEVP